MESYDDLVRCLLDLDAVKGCFKRELAKSLNIPVSNIKEVWLETDLIDGVAIQVIKVSFINVEISKEKLMDLPFKCIYENTIVFEIGDFVL